MPEQEPIQETNQPQETPEENQEQNLDSSVKKNNEQITHLTVFKDKEGILRNVENKSETKAKPIGVGRYRPFSEYLHNLKNLSRTKKVELRIVGENKVVKVDLPEKMLDRLAFFLRNQHKLEPDFDCGSFVYLMTDTPDDKLVTEKWNIVKMPSESELKEGDCVVFFQEVEENSHRKYRLTHIAIYIGDGLYLSRYGGGGPLAASTVEEMQKAFGGSIVRKLEPKENNEEKILDKDVENPSISKE